MEFIEVASHPRIAEYLDLLRKVSRATDPLEVQHQFSSLLRDEPEIQAVASVSLRGLEPGHYKITRFQRSTEFGKPWTDPWRNWETIPAHTGGFIGSVISTPTPKIIRNLTLRNDPVLADLVADCDSAFVIPLFDEGEPLNWSVSFRRNGPPQSLDDAAEFFLQANIIGRMTKTLVIARQVKELNARLTGQLEQIAQIQRSLLPDELPRAQGLTMASSYLTSNEAGGDYYDFFDMGDDRLGVIVADVSGHGAGAATVMAMLQAILHGCIDRHNGPAAMLDHANRQLIAKRVESNFVTAFFAVFDEKRRTLHYANAGHNRPHLRRRQGTIDLVEGAASVPLGILDDPGYEVDSVPIEPGDTVVLYTDGITEAFGPPPDREMFGNDRLVGALRDCSGAPECVIDSIHERLYHHTLSRSRADDQTIVAIRVED